MLQSNKQKTHEKLLDKIAKHNSLILLHNLQVFNNKNSKMSKRQKNKMFNTHLINQLVVYYPTFTLLKKTPQHLPTSGVCLQRECVTRHRGRYRSAVT